MFDRQIFQEILSQYKKDFPGQWWTQEKYKWEMVQWFQQHWDIEAEDFPGMLKTALDKTENMLDSSGHYPRSMLEQLASAAPEAMRSMFRYLYDETLDYAERIEKFKADAKRLLQRYGDRDRLQDAKKGYSSFQEENPISVYLWLKYPEKYYVYKYGVNRAASCVLKSSYVIKKGAYEENLRQTLAFYDEMRDELRKDKDIRDILQKQLTNECWPDQGLHILTTDFGFYIYILDKNKDEEKTEKEQGSWQPEGYDPQISRETWTALLNDETVFTTDSLTVMARLRAADGEASCTQLAETYGGTKNFYNVQSSALARRVAEKTGCPLYTNKDGQTQYWPVLYLSRPTEEEETGTYVWKLRPELADALADADLSGVTLHAEEPVLKEDVSVSAEPALPAYGREDFLAEVYMDGAAYDRLAALVRRKKNVILEGAPGVGKTFAARRLAWALMGEKDDSRIELVQFHQSYSYEDFILGYKPDGAGFILKEGVFCQFCEKAAARPEEDFFFLIDEINRGNLSRIFGEMLMAVEREYRGTAVRLPEGDRLFSVPENVYLIGMMNTADRSLALMDYALRRRFGFFEMRPGFDSEGFRAYGAELHSPKFDALIQAVKALNQAIADDPSLGRGFCIGHSYFCGGDGTEEWMESVVEYDLLPTLDEYWYDEEDTRRQWARRLREAVHGAE